ncbi:hypothetical protein [Brevibacillus daliensis]|uniref:hypothetical protein n=1 Tax=Brevibacillus daliensis TaxID=2892995 RepID=UPI001E579C82|nr:hypothetical protein [Brevibacillus daliensis]
MKEHKTEYDLLSRKQEGYTMYHPIRNIEVLCTEPFLKQWKARGFIVKSKGTISFI